MHIANQYQCLAAKGDAVAASVKAQRIINGIEQVGPDHRHLIDHQDVHFFNDVFGGAANALGPRLRPGRQLEQRVNRLALHVKCRNPGGGNHHQVLVELESQYIDQRGFTGTGRAGDKNHRRGCHTQQV